VPSQRPRTRPCRPQRKEQFGWWRLYGGLKVDQARRLKDLERENQRLKKAVSELTLDKLILKEALEGKY
jgi:putative transposase